MYGFVTDELNSRVFNCDTRTLTVCVTYRDTHTGPWVYFTQELETPFFSLLKPLEGPGPSQLNIQTMWSNIQSIQDMWTYLYIMKEITQVEWTLVPLGLSWTETTKRVCLTTWNGIIKPQTVSCSSFSRTFSHHDLLIHVIRDRVSVLWRTDKTRSTGNTYRWV